MRTPSFKFGIAVSVFLFAATSAMSAQPPASPALGPIPQPLRDAKAIFVSNAGADSGLFPSPFSGDSSRGYNQLYAQLKSAGRFELVSDPSAADLVLELQLTSPPGPTKPSKQYGASDPLPMFRLVVYDRKTHYVLWALTASVQMAFLQATHDRNFDDALSGLVSQFEALAGKSVAAPTP